MTDEMTDVPGADPIVREARKRFNRCSEWESASRQRGIDDYRFANGDSDNGFQWPDSIRRNRDTDSRPCLTMNIIKQHNLQISNEARKNKSQGKVLPTGGGATIESALAMQDIVRHIENRSNAQPIYTVARGFQIDMGIGWWRIVTDYVADNTFDQEVLLRPVNDPLSVFMDPDIDQKDGSDARFAFVFDNIPRDLWRENYPEFADLVGHNPMGVGGSDSDWVSDNSIRIAEYFRKTFVMDKLYSFVYHDERKNLRKSYMTAEMEESIAADPLTKSRPIKVEQVEWHLIAGDKIVDSTIWPGKYIPLIRCIGEEVVIDGILDRKGHTRAMKDPQRMLNYNASAQVEFVALQGKTPWIAPAKAIEEYESMWNTANAVNHSVLIWNNRDDEGNEIPAPQRTQPPTASPAYEVGMQTAFNQVMMVSGQWQNQMGMMGNERTGKAIALRQNQSDTATFHFQDNYEEALRFSTVQLIDLVPRIYDTRRVISIMGDDGQTFEMQIDPAAQQAYAEQLQKDGFVATRIFNPQMGMYDVAPGIGPAFGTRAEETAEALTLLLTQAPALVPVVGDLLLGSMSFDKAQEAAVRLRRMVPPQALGSGPSPNEQQLQQVVASLQKALAESLQKQGKAEIQLAGRAQLRQTDVFKAQTERLSSLKDFLPANPQGLEALIRQIVSEALGTSLAPVIDANANNLDIDGPGGIPNAKRAADGNHYIPDERRPGKFLRVEKRQ